MFASMFVKFQIHYQDPKLFENSPKILEENPSVVDTVETHLDSKAIQNNLIKLVTSWLHYRNHKSEFDCNWK